MTAKRLLVIDDEADFGVFVDRVARGLGFEVMLTRRAAEFQKAYELFLPTVILVDIVMPERDGIEIVTWLAEKGCKGRILIISGYSPRYAQAALEIGASQGLCSLTALKKPISLADLRGALDGHKAKTDNVAQDPRSNDP